MNQYFEVLKLNPLFERISREDLLPMLQCLGAFTKCYGKKEIILHSGDAIYNVGVVMSGAVKVVKEDRNANESMITEVRVGDTFGEVFACAEVYHSPVTVIAQEQTEVLFLNYKKIITTCNNSCIFHTQITENLLKIIANKCMVLNQKLDIVSQRTTRQKILHFLQYEGNGRKKIKVSLNREEMANYICVDRSAMSAELSKMQKEGLIRYHKDEFEMM